MNLNFKEFRIVYLEKGNFLLKGNKQRFCTSTKFICESQKQTNNFFPQLLQMFKNKQQHGSFVVKSNLGVTDRSTGETRCMCMRAARAPCQFHVHVLLAASGRSQRGLGKRLSKDAATPLRRLSERPGSRSRYPRRDTVT